MTAEPSLPTAEEINVFDTLDEHTALRHFLGKDLAEAEALFRANFFHYQEDLMWMGPRAFAYYLPAALRCVVGPAGSGDADDVHCLCGTLEFQVEHYGDELRPFRAQLLDTVQALLEQQLATPEPALAARLHALRDRLVDPE